MPGLKMVWYVDLPDWEHGLPEGSYADVAEFDSREESRKYLLDTWGMPKDTADFFITETAAD